MIVENKQICFYDRINTAVEQTVPVYTVKILSSDRPRITPCFTSSSAVAKRAHNASCLSVVSFNSTKRRVVFYC